MFFGRKRYAVLYLDVRTGCFYSSGRWTVSTCFISLYITVFRNTGINTSLSGWPMHTFLANGTWSFLAYHPYEALGVFLMMMVFGETLVVWWGWCGGNTGMAAWWPPAPSTCMRSKTGPAASPHSLAPLWLTACCTLSSRCPAAVLLLLLPLLLLLLGVTRAPQLPHTLLDASVVEASTSLPVFK